MRRMRRAAQEIKLRRIFCVLALENDRFCSHWQINAIQPVEGKRFSIRMNRARPADVDGAQFAAFEEKGAARFLVVRQFNRLQRHYSADHEAVEVGEQAAQFARREQVGDGKSVAKLLGGQARHILRTGHTADGVLEHGTSFAKSKPSGKTFNHAVVELFSGEPMFFMSAANIH